MGIQRIEDFLTAAKTAQIKDLKAICRQESAYLRESYQTLASLKNGFTAYRNAVKDAFADDPERQAVIFALMRLQGDESAAFKQARNVQIVQDRSHLRPIHDVDAFILKGVQLLGAGSYLDMILGLCALTGRRTAEIGTSAVFTPQGEYQVRFDGQLKTKGRGNVAGYVIPVFHDPAALVTTLAKIRTAKPEFIGNPERFHNAASKELNQRVKKHFAAIFAGPHKPKDLRAAYAEIAYHLFCDDPSIAKQQYGSNILGHGEDDASTSESYVDFYIANQ